MKLAAVRQHALALPEVTEAPHFQFGSFRVRGKIFVTVPPDERHIHVFVAESQREPALAIYPEFLEALTWGGKVVGLRVALAEAVPSVVRQLVSQAWRNKAPKGLQARALPVKAIETPQALTVTVQPLTPDRWPHLEAVFNAKGCSIARGCWCMYYRHSGRRGKLEPGQTPSTRSKSELRSLAAADPPPGLIGYRGGVPVGWISLGPRPDFAKLAKSPVMKPVDDQAVWSVVCLVVPTEYRRQGVARALLDGAVAYARARGVRLLEGYPVDKAQPAAGASSWFGSKSMFDEAGFQEVARRKPARPVVRLRLDRP